MREQSDAFPPGTVVAVVTFSAPEMVAAYVEHHQLDFPVLIDSDRSSYRTYGLERGSALRVWGWKALMRYVEIIWKKRNVKSLAIPTEDTLQLGGDFVVGPDGKLLYGFWGEGPDDRPPVASLIKAASSA